MIRDFPWDVREVGDDDERPIRVDLVSSVREVKSMVDKYGVIGFRVDATGKLAPNQDGQL